MEIKDILNISIIFLFFIFLIVIFLFIRKKINLYLDRKIKLDYENDILFLSHIIDFQFNKHLIDFKTMYPTVEFINTTIYKELSNEICVSIIKSISNEYKNKLSLYFSSDGLYTYIAKNVDLKMTEVILEMNAKKV